MPRRAACDDNCSNMIPNMAAWRFGTANWKHRCGRTECDSNEECQCVLGMRLLAEPSRLAPEEADARANQRQGIVLLEGIALHEGNCVHVFYCRRALTVAFVPRSWALLRLFGLALSACPLILKQLRVNPKCFLQSCPTGHSFAQRNEGSEGQVLVMVGELAVQQPC